MTRRKHKRKIEEQWIINLECKLEKIKLTAQIESQKRYCILRVVRGLREVYENDFNPKLVPFGPYHHNQDHLKLFEPFKHQALINYLNRAGGTLAEVAEAMRKTVKEHMESYQGLEETWTEDRFTELMLLDECFLLDLLIWHSVQFHPLSLVMILQTDTLRLENQLPISVLANLIEVGGQKDQDTTKFFDCCYPTISRGKMVKDIKKMGHHYLDIYTKNMTLEGDYFYDCTYSVHPTSELIDSGVQFIKSKSKCLKDISFENGVLKLPKIDVNKHTESILLNMIAYEQLINGQEAVTSYVLLMDNLINCYEDVALLREKGIIKGMLGSDQEIADIFNRLPKPIVKELSDNKHYKAVDERSGVNVNLMLNDYYNGRMNRWRASFMQSYFKNPWVFSSLLGAFILLILTAFQTLYTIMPYYKGS